MFRCTVDGGPCTGAASASESAERNQFRPQAEAGAVIANWQTKIVEPKITGRTRGARRMAVPIQHKLSELCVRSMSNPPGESNGPDAADSHGHGPYGHFRMSVYRPSALDNLTRNIRTTDKIGKLRPNRPCSCRQCWQSRGGRRAVEESWGSEEQTLIRDAIGTAHEFMASEENRPDPIRHCRLYSTAPLHFLLHAKRREWPNRPR